MRNDERLIYPSNVLKFERTSDRGVPSLECLDYYFVGRLAVTTYFYVTILPEARVKESNYHHFPPSFCV